LNITPRDINTKNFPKNHPGSAEFARRQRRVEWILLLEWEFPQELLVRLPLVLPRLELAGLVLRRLGCHP
jgi:hypothetical protein